MGLLLLPQVMAIKCYDLNHLISLVYKVFTTRCVIIFILKGVHFESKNHKSYATTRRIK